MIQPHKGTISDDVTGIEKAYKLFQWFKPQIFSDMVRTSKPKPRNCGCRHKHPPSECWRLHPEKAPKCSKCDKVGHAEITCWGMKMEQEEEKIHFANVELNFDDYAF